MRGQGIRLALCLWLAANASGLSADTQSVLDLNPDVRSDSVIYGDNRDNEGPVYQLDYVCFVQWTQLLPSRYCLGPAMSVSLPDMGLQEGARVEFEIDSETFQLDLDRLGGHKLEQGEALYQALIDPAQDRVHVTVVANADGEAVIDETVTLHGLTPASTRLMEKVDRRVESQLHTAFWFVLAAYGLFAGMLMALGLLVRKWWRRSRGLFRTARRRK